jgi:CheY-like chemotaxis protein
MDPFPSPEPITDPEKLLEAFEELMPFRVRDILLVSSLYDSFILREDGRLNELLIGDSLELHLQHIPGITHVSSGPEAIALARSDARFNLIVTNLTVGAMGADELARQVKQAGLDVPVIVLAYDYRQIKDFVARNPVTDIERIFLWQGNVRILIALIKYIEDKRNVLHDTSVMGVPVILLVEDNIRYISSFLPMIYTELITQSRSLFSEGLNVAHKLVRMRARPKILLCSNYEDAAEQALKYREYLFGVVSDVEYPLGGKLTPDAGFELANMVRTLAPDVPIVLQSSRTKFMTRAHAEGYSFLRKRSPTMLGDLRRLLRSCPRHRLELAGKTAAPGTRRVPCLPQRAQPFFTLAAGPDRIRSRPETPAAQSVRLRHPGGFAPGHHRLHRRIPARTAASPDRRLQSLRLPAQRQVFSAHRRRLARGQGARTGFRPPPVS